MIKLKPLFILRKNIQWHGNEMKLKKKKWLLLLFVITIFLTRSNTFLERYKYSMNLREVIILKNLRLFLSYIRASIHVANKKKI